jgi:hypothetical protein
MGEGSPLSESLPQPLGRTGFRKDSYFDQMEPIELQEGEVYRLVGTAGYEGLTVDGEFIGKFGSGLVFRDMRTGPGAAVEFRPAWWIEWSDLASIETPDVLSYGAEN